MLQGSPTPFVDAARALRASAPYGALRERFGEITRLPLAAAAWTLELLAEDLGRPLLVVVPHEVNAYAWLEAVRLFTGDAEHAVYFPAPPLSPYQETEISLLVRAEESVAVDRIAAARAPQGDGWKGNVGKPGPLTVLTTPRALFRRLPRAEEVRPAVLDLEVDEEIPLDDLVEHLVTWGYRRADLVVEVGQFAMRGGVFDVFPPGEDEPVRLDLFGDTIDTLHRFDPESQRSGDSLHKIRIRPLALFPQGASQAAELADLLAEIHGAGASIEVAEKITALREEGGFDGWEHYLPLLRERTLTLADLLPDALVVSLDQETLGEEVGRHATTLFQEHETRAAQKRLAIAPERLEHPEQAVRDVLEAAHVRLGDLIVEHRLLGSADAAIDFGASATDLFHDQLERFPREVETARARGDRVVLVAPSDHGPRLGELLEAREIPLGPRGVELAAGDLQRGFHLPAAALAVYGERQLLRRSPVVRRAKKRKRTKFGPFLSSLRDLKIGDYVVHADHGIGQFVGLRTLGGASAPRTDLPPALREAAPEKSSESEVMEISYSTGQRLLVPLDRLDLVQRYSGIEGVAPKLDKLGGTSWNRTKKRIKKGMRDMAEELLKLYAARQLAQAPKISGASDLVHRFEAAFEHEETADQLDAMEAISEDLTHEQPMDRLLCGDVGFGKTEVAMRAALRVVDGGYQVAVLAPTTILADQHLRTFSRRFRGLPVNVDMISRFRTTAEAKEIQARTEAGEVDVLIGTHRLLQKGVKFAKLGLVIIDEEQRFGVAHKEKLKHLRKDVHVLAMSATPVPRTLQLSLAGVRDLSLIETPPRDRMAVETAIVPFDGQLIREAVELELERGGQIYFVHNRVESIDGMASFLREILPGIRLTVGHGQLDEKELARRMRAFEAGEHDLLLATTIIENGIDIPNVNTMIIHHADRFGLSQLYQLRGRVGRSDQLAYCYLLVEGDRTLSQDARKRLDAIREFTELGAGFRVAGRDLEIRGAGNLLGGEQSGHISALGIETYLKLLEEAVAELRGEPPEEAPSVSIDLPVQMSIPEEYVGDAQLRLDIYRRLATGEEPEDDLLAELRDRFGAPPEGVRMLLKASAVKRLAESLRLQGISARGSKLVLRLRQDARIDPDRLIELVQSRDGTRFSPSGELILENVPASASLDTARDLLERLGAPS